MVNPYISIWLKPKETIDKFIHQRINNSILLPPIIILGLSMGLETATEMTLLLEDDQSPLALLGIYCGSAMSFVGIAFILLSLIHPWIIKTIGKIWNGKSTSAQIANVISLSLIPYSPILVYQVLAILTMSDPSNEFINAGVYFILYLIGLRIQIIGISVVQKFSYGLSLLNLLISILPYIVLSLIINQ